MFLGLCEVLRLCGERRLVWKLDGVDKRCVLSPIGSQLLLRHSHILSLLSLGPLTPLYHQRAGRGNPGLFVQRHRSCDYACVQLLLFALLRKRSLREQGRRGSHHGHSRMVQRRQFCGASRSAVYRPAGTVNSSALLERSGLRLCIIIPSVSFKRVVIIHHFPSVSPHAA